MFRRNADGDDGYVGDSKKKLTELPGQLCSSHSVPTPPPLPLRLAKAGGKSFEPGNTPLLPTGIGERYGQTISNLGHVVIAPMCDLPYKQKC